MEQINFTKRYGIIGGTFDPIHIGHLITAQEVKDKLNLDKVFFIPVGTPPHKDSKNVTDKNIRLEMVKSSVEGADYFEVLDIEVDRNGFTYTIDTLQELKLIYPFAKFYYIIGADVVFDLFTWKDYEKVFKLIEFVAVLRNDFEADKLKERINELIQKHNASITILDTPAIGISASKIRERVKQGRPFKFFVTDAVFELICNSNLYI